MERKLRNYIIPNILAMAGTSCYVLADTFFISLAEGADGITALNLVLPVYGLMYAIGSMLGAGSATRFSLSRAAGKKEGEAYFSNSIFWTLLISVPFLAGGIFRPGEILSLLGADPEILRVGRSYIQVVLCFAPLFMLNYTFTAFTRNDGAPKIAMAATLISGIFNIVFDYILMFPLKMGMTGAALATGLSPVVSMGICLLHFLSGKNTVAFLWTPPSLRRLLSACQLGTAAFVGEMSSGITTLIFNFLLLHLAGNTAVAAYGVIANIALVGTALLNGVSLGLQPVASAAHGRMDREGEKRIFRHALRIGEVIALAALAAALLLPEQMVTVFNREDSRELASYAVLGMRLYFLGFPLAALNMIRSGFYGAVGRGCASSAIALSRGLAAILAMAFLLSEFLGVVGVWLAFPAAEAVTLIGSLWIPSVRKKVWDR